MDYKDESIWLLQGNCLERMKELEDNSVDSIVTDPPYGLSFMNKKWDHQVPSVEIWKECLRVLKPGGYLLSFAGTRTQHRMACNIEDAGFEIRDMIAWVYGTGFPKSMDVSKAIYKANGTAAAHQWQGWGTALKPALEPVTVARKPLIATVAANVLTHGTGALNIDGCRIGNTRRVPASLSKNKNPNGFGPTTGKGGTEKDLDSNIGRWPANLIHDGSDEVVSLFPDSNGCGGSVPRVKITGYGNGVVGTGESQYIGGERIPFESGSGSAARFFYCAKSSKKDRGECNTHPTVKPTELMRYLCRLITPKDGIVLDPFMGSGSTGKAAVLEGFNFIGVEMENEYFNIAKERILNAINAETTNGT